MGHFPFPFLFPSPLLNKYPSAQINALDTLRGCLLTASNDHALLLLSPGLTWDRLVNAPDAYWGAIASSQNGSRLIAGAQQLLSQQQSALFHSDDFGISWTPPLANYSWPFDSDMPPAVTRVVSSPDGSYLAGLFASYLADTDCECLYNGNGQISISTDAGSEFRKSQFLPLALYTDIAASSDGSTVVAVQWLSGSGPGTILISRDSGETLVPLEHAPTGLWSGVAISGRYRLSKGKANKGAVCLLVVIHLRRRK